jgi:hypothetical protein
VIADVTPDSNDNRIRATHKGYPDVWPASSGTSRLSEISQR